MKNHMNACIYETFYIMRDISYRLNNPLDTKRASKSEINIQRYMKNSKISRNGKAKFPSLSV